MRLIYFGHCHFAAAESTVVILVVLPTVLYKSHYIHNGPVPGTQEWNRLWSSTVALLKCKYTVFDIFEVVFEVYLLCVYRYKPLLQMQLVYLILKDITYIVIWI